MHIQVIFTTLVLLSGLVEIEAIKSRRRSKRAEAIVHSCSSKIFCQGNLLDTVQRFRIYPDSKTFTDMVQKNEESVTLQNFEKMMEKTVNKPTKNDVVTFVNENFEIGNESDIWIPQDFKEAPEFLNRIKELDIKEFASVLVSYWAVLGRKVKAEVQENPSQHSLIPVPNGFIVPGGRFREIYYWDSYWIIKGLLLSEMKGTVKGMLENFIYFLKTYGFIPNGSRKYYLNRSQPPLFTAMVGLYIDETGDTSWLKNNIEYIEKELSWWLDHRTTTIKKNGVDYQMAHYNSESNTPRPESYAEDVTTCAHFKSGDEQTTCYNALKAGAETGWDFSTRWIFDANGSANANLTNINCQRVIPVDLNGFLCKSFRLLSNFYGKIGNSAKKSHWATYADKWLKAMEDVHYNEGDGIWYDYDSLLLKQRKLFFPSNFVPLWADCYDLEKKDTYGKKAAKYLYDQKIDKYMGGIPTSITESGEQWDLPNAWPPLQEFVVLGLHQTGNEEAKKLAKEFATRWINANMKGFAANGDMFEKYDAIKPGTYGGGGEYTVQLGFGWTNGVVLSFINQYNSAGISKDILNPLLYLVIFSLLSYARKLLCS